MTDSKKPMIAAQDEASQTTSLPAIDLAPPHHDAIVPESSRRKLRQQPAVATDTVNSMPRLKELRKANRYRLTSSAVIRWRGVDFKIHEAFGTIRDISTCGVFVECTAPMRLASNVELEITAPGLRPKASGPELQFEGRVVRAESRGGSPGFAVAGFLSVSKPGGPVC